MKTQHPMKQFEDSCVENQDSTADKDNNVEKSIEPRESYQTGGGLTSNETSDCITEEEAINGNLKVYNLPALDKTKFDPLQFLNSRYDRVMKILRTVLMKRQNVKWYLTMQARFKKEKKDQTEKVEPHFHGRCHVALKAEDLEQSLRDSIKKIMTSFLEYQRQGSNWILDKVMGLTLNVAKYKPLRGSSFIPLPIRLRAKKAVVNVQNSDQKCFQWAIISALHPATHHVHRVSNYIPHADKLDFTGIDFPVQMKDISKFENQNDITVNVFGYEKGNIYPIHLTKKRFVRHVDLLVISNGNKSHFCWIKNFNRLMNDGQHDHQKFYCCYCLHGFTKSKLLEKHRPYCQIHGAQRTEMPPEENKWLTYTDVSKQLKVPFIIYADFECIAEKISTCQPDVCKSSTTKLAKHISSEFTYKIVGSDDNLTEDHVTYRGTNVAETFVRRDVCAAYGAGRGEVDCYSQESSTTTNGDER
jgi:hypothetical protein